MNYTQPLQDLNKSSTAQYGGKAASLGELLQAGIPVPAGFAISTVAFTHFSATEPSPAFINELLAAYYTLGAPRVAVRSSAVAEDGATASWAGQLESYLNVTRDDLLASVQKCWKSIDSARAVAYAKDKNVTDDSRKVGVAVQTMVDSQVSGVIFTANPITGDTSRMMIECSYGLGELIVQGAITPDNYELTKKPLTIVSFEIATKLRQMVYRDGHNQAIDVSLAEANKPALSDEQVLRLAKLGLQIEKHYGAPLDIEWAHVENCFYVVQARPITAL